MNPLQVFEDDLDGVTFVEASAGTGKTYAIEMLYLRLLVERRLTPEQIVVVTYTNAAAAELRQRIRSRLQKAVEWVERDRPSPPGSDGDWTRYLSGQSDRGAIRRNLLSALYGFDRASISTIHSFCQRVLQEHAFESGAAFQVEMIADQEALVDEVVRDFVASRFHEAPPYLIEQVWGAHGFAGLARFAARVAGQPDLLVTPGIVAGDGGEDSWRAAFDRAGELWGVESAQILELTAGNSGLHKNAKLDGGEIERGMAEVFQSAEPLAGARYPDLAKFTPEYLKWKTKKKSVVPTHEFFECCSELLENEGLIRVRSFAQLAEYARSEIRRRKGEMGVVYFDDLLSGVSEALRDEIRGPGLAERLRGRFQAALIDEFQDTDQLQYDIFKKIFLHDERPLFLIGDPKQSIYSFRGADVHAYVGAREDAARQSTLAINWRSSDRAVGAVNRLFGVADAFVIPDIGFSPVDSTGKVAELDAPGEAGVRFVWCAPPGESPKIGDYRRQIRRGVASRIVELLQGGARIGDRELMPRDIAVLCRKNDEAAEIQLELRGRGVPTVLTGDLSVFETPEAGEMARVLAALADPRDAGAIRAALCTPLCGVSGDELLAMRDDESTWLEWSDRFRRWRAGWDEHGFMAAFGKVRDECKVAERLLSQRGGERQLTNYLHLAERLQVKSRELRSGPQGLVDWLALMSDGGGEGEENAAESVQVRLESDADAVVLTTVHKSKGLEYPVVFLPYLWTPPRPVGKTLVEYHDSEAGRRIWVGAEAPAEIKKLVSEEAAGEEMRLAYVALTRAQHATFVVVPPYRRGGPSPLQRLLGTLSRERLDEIVGGSEGTIAVEDLEVSQDRLVRSGDRIDLVEPPRPRAVTADWRVSSFSGLTSAMDGLSAQEEDGLDLDEVGPVAGPSEESSDDGEVTLADLEGGTRVGLMIHSIFEDLDFQSQDPAELQELVSTKATAFRAGSAYVDELCRTIDEVRNAELPGVDAPLRLSEVSRRHRLDELEFILPVSDPSRRSLTPARLSEVLRAHQAPSPSPDYAERAGALGFGEFSGFLRGFIDMVFEHSGRWYVVDYKSNFLGRRRSDYAPSRLLLPMRHHDYFLQYLLYVVATDRYLSYRLPEYSYETHFGGVFYLFLRGMDGSSSSTGVFRDRPSARLVADLSGLFGQGAGRE